MKNKKFISEIRIRNVDAAAIARIDQLAAAANKSRNQYLKEYIESLSVLNELKEMEEQYNSLVNNVLTVISHNTEQIRKLRKEIESRIDDE